MTQFIVTANRLGDGEVVYLTADRQWSESLADSAVVEDDAADALLAEVEMPQEELKIIGPYLMKAEIVDGHIRPVSQREIIRAKGPTTHLHFGKQSGEGAAHV